MHGLFAIVKISVSAFHKCVRFFVFHGNDCEDSFMRKRILPFVFFIFAALMSLLALSACFDNSLPVHTVFIVSDGPGSVSIQKNSFALGASVNFSPEPEEGATCLKSKMYIRAYDNPSSAKIYLNGSSRFIMPDYDVLIYVPFVSDQYHYLDLEYDAKKIRLDDNGDENQLRSGVFRQDTVFRLSITILDPDCYFYGLFDKNSGELFTDQTDGTFSMPARNVNLVLEVRENPVLTVNIAGKGSISVIDSETDELLFDGKESFSFSVSPGRLLNFFPLPDEGFSFTVKWEILPSDQSDALTFVTVYDPDDPQSGALQYEAPASDTSITVTFELNRHAFDVETVMCSVSAFETSYFFGDTLTLTAFPDDGCCFVGWFEGDVLVSDMEELNYVMPDRDVLLRAVCEEIPLVERTLTLRSELCTLNITSHVCYPGDEVFLSAFPDDNTHFVGWFEDETLVSSSSSFTFVMPDRDVTLIAICETDPVYLLSVTGVLCRAEPLSGTFFAGDEVSLSVTPDLYTHFTGWFEEDVLVSDQSSFVFTMPARNVSLTAVCEWDPQYLLEANATEGGSVAPEISYLFAGQSTLLTATADTDYTFIGWYENELLISESPLLTYTMPSHDVVLLARFKSDYIFIDSPDDLKAVENDMTTKYRLTADIELPNFVPIGIKNGSIIPFEGVFDGNGYTITLNASAATAGTNAYIGLFAQTAPQSEVHNLSVVFSCDAETAVNNLYFGVVCENKGLTERIRASGEIKLKNPQAVITAGAIAGYNEGVLNECVSEASILADGNNPHIGGIAGDNSGDIKNSRSTANISAVASGTAEAGGIAGEHWGKISFSWAAGTISASGTISYSGGIAGNSIGEFRSITAGGSVSAQGSTVSAGAVAGMNYSEKSLFSACYRLENTSFELLLNDTVSHESNSVWEETVTTAQADTPDFYTEVLGWDTSLWLFNHLDAKNFLLPVLRFETDVLHR